MPITTRIVTDRETGKLKGYAFCEYKDTETAKSAIRNLNKVEFKGRQLHVDTSEKHAGGGGGKDVKQEEAKPAPSQALLPTHAASSQVCNETSGIIVDGIWRCGLRDACCRRLHSGPAVRDEYVLYS